MRSLQPFSEAWMMRTDWGALMDKVMSSHAQNVDAEGLFRVEPGTENDQPGTDCAPETQSWSGFHEFVPGVATVTGSCEKVRLEHRANAVPSSFSKPGGDGFGEAFAPVQVGSVPSCSCCAYLRRPGLSDGLCGGDREDLPHAYTSGHPLRRLPGDGGADCPRWALHWSFPRVLPRHFTQGTESPGFCVVSGVRSK